MIKRFVSREKQYEEGRIQVEHKPAVAVPVEQELSRLREELRQVTMEREVDMCHLPDDTVLCD
jgi:transposase-like protein